MISAAAAFGWLLAYLQVPAQVVAAIRAVADDPLAVLLLMNVVLLVLGTFMDMAPLIIICTPIFLPVATAFGVNPLQFGVMLDPERRHRPDHAAGRLGAVRRHRDRQDQHRARRCARSGRSISRGSSCCCSSRICRRCRCGCRACCDERATRRIAEILALGPVIAVVTIERAADALPLARALRAGGIRVLEVTLRSALRRSTRSSDRAALSRSRSSAPAPCAARRTSARRATQARSSS